MSSESILKMLWHCSGGDKILRTEKPETRWRGGGTSKAFKFGTKFEGTPKSQQLRLMLFECTVSKISKLMQKPL